MISHREVIRMCDRISAYTFQKNYHCNWINWILDELQTPLITHSVYPWITMNIQLFLQHFKVLLTTPQIPLSICCWFLIILGNCGCFLICWFISSWYQGYQLPKPNNILFLDCHPNLIPPLLTPGLVLMWLNEFSLPPSILLEINI